jgi:hypothetical protein
MGLGWGAELWNPVSDHPAYEGKVKELVAVGRAPDEADVRLLLTQGLLLEVIHAAGAIEYTVEKIEALADAAQSSYDAQFPRAPEEEYPELGITAALHEADDAYIEYANLLTWLRALDDRISREARSDEGKRRLGLLPAVADDHALKKRLRGANSVLAQTLRPERELANYALHASVIPHAQKGVPVDPQWGVRFPIPDPITEPVYTPTEFTFTLNRELVSFAREVLAAVETFMDELLSAFEAEQITRTTWTAPGLG